MTPAHRAYLTEGVFARPVQNTAAPVRPHRAARALLVASLAVLLVIGAFVASLASAQSLDVCSVASFESAETDAPMATSICVAPPTDSSVAAPPVTIRPSLRQQRRSPDWRAAPAMTAIFLTSLAGIGLAFRRRPKPPVIRAPEETIEARAAADSRMGGRSSLEDRSAALTFANGLTGVVVADGLGGHPGGARAASIATEIARMRIEELRAVGRPTANLVLDVVRGIFPRVAEALQAEDSELGLARHGVDALRTTLIVGLRVGHQLVAGAIGDGGLLVVGLETPPVRVIEPHRGEASNIVTASLGPITEGEPVFRVMPISDDDIVVIGSDGLVDRVADDFYPKVRTVLDEHPRPADAVRFVLDTLLAGNDARATFDDNITFAIIAPEFAA